MTSIIVQTDTLAVSSQSGGSARITAVAFNRDNRPVANANILFDVQPRVASFRELVRTTDASGMAVSVLDIPEGTAIGTLRVVASACEKSGEVGVTVVSGRSNKPVSVVVLEADPSTVGNAVDTNINLKASVFDSDNQAMNDINVLFVTEVGQVSPLVEVTRPYGSENGVATSLLRVPAGTFEQDFFVTALAGGVTGRTRITVVQGRIPPGGKLPNVPPGKPASLLLSASPARIQVAGTGGTDLASISARVLDNNGQPLSGVRIYFSVVPGESAPGAVILAPTQATPATPDTQSRCPIDAPFAVSDSAGFAIVQLKAGSQSGPVTVQACADTVSNDIAVALVEKQPLVAISAGPVARIRISLNPRFIDNNDGTYLSTLSASMVDAQGNAVEDGTPVVFEVVLRRRCVGGPADGTPCSSDAVCNGGACLPDESDPAAGVVITNGAVTNSLPPCDVSQFTSQTGIPVVPQPGNAVTCLKFTPHMQGTEVWVRARSGGVVNAVNGEVITLPGVVGSLTASVRPSTIRVDDTNDGAAVVRVTAVDDLGQPVENVRVRFSTNIGTIDRSALTDANGEAVATLVVPAGTPSGTLTLRITGGGVSLNAIDVPVVNVAGTPTPTPGEGDRAGALEFVG
ncbi:MAG: hypothetical protein ONB06_05540, partial [candidate division KSB1 bacterium]|nr:hypothetical protein [candidate division KSB1 bacterium]